MKRSLYILLVEDDPSLGPMTFHVLIKLGHRSELAITAPAVYRHLSQPHEFALVLLDLHLGDELSEPLILRLRSEKFEMPKIVIFSSQPVAELHRVARAIGAHAIVQKPASIEQIDAAIELATA